MKKNYTLSFFFILFFNLGFVLAKPVVTKLNVGLVLPSATITLTGSPTCKDSASPIITFSGSGGTAPYTFTYKINGGSDIITGNSTGNDFVINPSTSAIGNFIFTLVSVKDATNAIFTLTNNNVVTLVINALPVANMVANNSICVNSTINIGGPNVAGSTYSWSSIPTGFTSLLSNPLVSPTVTTTYTLIETNNSGCTKQNSTTITVNPLPVIDFNFTNNASCSGTAIQFTSIVIGGGTYTYSWGFGDGGTSTATNPTHSFVSVGNSIGSFDVVLNVVNSATGCGNSLTKSISVKQSPDMTINGSGGISIFNNAPIFKKCQSTPFTFTFLNSSSTAVTNTNYIINWGDSSPRSRANPFAWNFDNDDEFKICKL